MLKQSSPPQNNLQKKIWDNFMKEINFSLPVIQRIRKALKDGSAGNEPCSMTDLDLAVGMLDELIRIKSELE